MANILVVAEMHDGHVRKSTHSAITFARNAGDVLDPRSRRGRQSRRRGSDRLEQRRSSSATTSAAPTAETHAPTIAAVAKTGFDVVAFCASSFGKDVAPRVAAKLGAGYAPDISGVKDEGGKLVYRRPVYAGNAFATCTVNTAIQVVSARRASSPRPSRRAEHPPLEDVALAAKDAAAGRDSSAWTPRRVSAPDLGEARVIVPAAAR